MINTPTLQLKNPVLTPTTIDTNQIVDPIQQKVDEIQKKEDANERQKREEILKYGIYHADPVKANSVKIQNEIAGDRDNWMKNTTETIAKYKTYGKKIPANEIIKWESDLVKINDKIKLTNSIQSQAESAAQKLADDYEGKRYNHDETKSAIDDWVNKGVYSPTKGFLRDAEADIPAILQTAKAARTTNYSSLVVDYNRNTGEYMTKNNSSEGDEGQCRDIFRTAVSRNTNNINGTLAKKWVAIQDYGQSHPDEKLKELGGKTLKEYKQQETSDVGNNVRPDLGIAAYWGEDQYWKQAQINVKQGEKEGIRSTGFIFGGKKYGEIVPQWENIEGKAGIPMQIINRLERPNIKTSSTEKFINAQTGELEEVPAGTEVQLHGFNLNRGNRGYYAISVNLPEKAKFQTDKEGTPLIFDKETKMTIDGSDLTSGETLGKKHEAKFHSRNIVMNGQAYDDIELVKKELIRHPGLANDIKLVDQTGKDKTEIPLEVKTKKGEPRSQEKILYKEIKSDAELDMVSRNDVSRNFYRPTEEPGNLSKKEISKGEVWDKAKLDRYYKHVSSQTGKSVDDPQTKKMVNDYLKNKNIVVE
jgi:hypothetical protein